MFACKATVIVRLHEAMVTLKCNISVHCKCNADILSVRGMNNNIFQTMPMYSHDVTSIMFLSVLGVDK